MEQNRICRRCLAKEMPDPEYYQNMYDYIAAMDETIKAPDEVYQNRLSHCKECFSPLSAVKARSALPSSAPDALHFRWLQKRPDLFLVLFLSR